MKEEVKAMLALASTVVAQIVLVRRSDHVPVMTLKPDDPDLRAIKPSLLIHCFAKSLFKVLGELSSSR